MTDPNDDLAWRAFRYLSGDLSPEQLEQFEEELSESQEAREALAAEVELFGALHLAGELAPRPDAPTPARRSSLGRFAGRGLATLTAVAAVVLLWVSVRPMLFHSDSPDTPTVAAKRPDRSELAASELAALWSAQANTTDYAPLDQNEFSNALVSMFPADLAATDWSDDADPAFDDEFDSSEWMFAAVSGLAAAHHAN